MFLIDDLVKKLLDVSWEKIKEKRAPRRRLAQAVLRIQESLIRCQEAYSAYQQSPASEDDYYEAIGQLIRTLYVVRDILPVLDPQIAAKIIDYTGDEVENYEYPLASTKGKYAAFNELSDGEKKYFKHLTMSWGATGIPPNFNELISDLRRFLRDNFTVDDMF